MHKIMMAICVFFISILIISNATAVPQTKTSDLDQLIEKKKSLKILDNEILDLTNLVEILLKILQFLENMCILFINLFTPFVPLLESLEKILDKILEIIEPWAILGEAIIDVIDSINALIEVIKNIISPPTLNI